MTIIEARRRIGITELQAMAEGSRATFQRDLNELEKAGRIERSYGMVRYIESEGEDLWTNVARLRKIISNLEAKKRIGRRAQQLIGEQETIFVTHGTTTQQIFNQVDEGKHFSVFTDGIDILCKCAGLRNVNTYLVGGSCNFGTMQMEYIPLMTSHLENINIQKLFMGVAAVSHINGVTFYDFASYQLLQMIADKCDEIVVVADSSKFGRNAMVDCIPIHKIKTIVTDTELDDATCHEFEKIGINCIRV